MLFVIRKTIAFAWVASIFALAVCVAEEPPETTPVDTLPAATIPVRETYTDGDAGYSLVVPTGYRKLTDEESRKVYQGISDVLSKNKEIGERALKKPPANFIGPVNPKQPEENPPSFAIGFTENKEQIDPAQMQRYKETLEENLKNQGAAANEIVLRLIKVDGIPSLQVEREITNPLNSNIRDHVIQVIVPGKGKWYELIFNYSTGQEASVRVSLQEALETFKVSIHPPENIENRKKWTRVLYYTVGFGLAGVVLSLIIRKLTGGKTQTAPPSGKDTGNTGT